MPDTQFGLAWSQEVIRAFREMKTAHQFIWISFCCLLILVHIVHKLKIISTKNWIFSTSRSSRIAGDFMMRWTKLAHWTWTFEWLKVERGVTLMFDVCSGTRLLVREWDLLIRRRKMRNLRGHSRGLTVWGLPLWGSPVWKGMFSSMKGNVRWQKRQKKG